jgi:GntR family transcriptional regulator, transcriptional repressor for pyruvate dehydrogenase complex
MGQDPTANRYKVQPVVVGKTLSQAVTEAILDGIRAGEYRPGDRLPTEKELMAQYGVGRNVAREAVQALVAMGLVEVRPGRGGILLGVDTSRAMDSSTVAALLLDNTVDDLNEFRRVIEVEIATCAAQRATDADVEAIRVQLEHYRTQIESGGPLAAAELTFHGAIAKASHNAVYIQVLETLHELLSKAREMTEGVEWARAKSLEEHELIFAAIEARDPKAAHDAMLRHMQLAFEATAEARRRRKGDPAADST